VCGCGCVCVTAAAAVAAADATAAIKIYTALFKHSSSTQLRCLTTSQPHNLVFVILCLIIVVIVDGLSPIGGDGANLLTSWHDGHHASQIQARENANTAKQHATATAATTTLRLVSHINEYLMLLRK